MWTNRWMDVRLTVLSLLMLKMVVGLFIHFGRIVKALFKMDFDVCIPHHARSLHLLFAYLVSFFVRFGGCVIHPEKINDYKMGFGTPSFG